MILPGIAISGKAASGKSHLRALVVDELVARGADVAHLCFADEVKTETLQRFGVRKGDPRARELLICVGQGTRHLVPNYWLHRLTPKLNQARRKGIVVVLDDVRYLNELAFLRNQGFATVRIDVDARRRAQRLLLAGEDPQFAYSAIPSECELDDLYRWDLLLENPKEPDLREVAAKLAARATEPHSEGWMPDSWIDITVRPGDNPEEKIHAAFSGR